MLRRTLAVAFAMALLHALPGFAQDLNAPYAENRVLVRFAPGTAATDRAVLRNALLSSASRPLGLVPDLELVQTPLAVTQAVAVLANNPNVVYVEPDYVVEPTGLIPNDNYFYIEWGLHNTGQTLPVLNDPGIVDADIDMPEAWEALLADTASPVVVAVIDSGLQLDHPDLTSPTSAIWSNPGEIPGNGIDDDNNGFIDDINGWDFLADDNDPSDETGHGSHTAGTIAAIANNAEGIAGICPSCRIMPLRFLGPAGGSTADAIEALAYAVARGAGISNNSWSSTAYSQALYDAIEAAGQARHLFVTSAGNDGNDIDFYPRYPASYGLDNIIAVAATTNDDQLASFSNFGAAGVDLGAPGLNIASLNNVGSYAWKSGTSMAAPHVAGVAALLQSYFPALAGDSGQTRAIILASTRPVPALSGNTATGGMLNAFDAVQLARAPPPTPEPEPLPAVPAPATPTDLSATDLTDGSARLAWTPVDGANAYRIEREAYQSQGRYAGSWAKSTSFTATTPPYTDAPGTQDVRYRIAAENDAGSSAMSAWVYVSVTRCHWKKGC